MKTFFMIIVIFASLYLLLPEKSPANMAKSIMDKIDQHLPQHKIENAAEQLLAQVDNKLKSFESSLNAEQNVKIKSLEDKILALKKVQAVTVNTKQKVAAVKEPITKKSIVIKPVVKRIEDISPTKTQTVSPVEAATKTKTAIAMVEDSLIKEKSLTEQKVLSAKNDKKWQLQRQASLQDIAQRMNETSLNALTF